MPFFRPSRRRDGDDVSRSTDISDSNVHPAEHAAREPERFTPSPVGQSSQGSVTNNDEILYGGQHDDFHPHGTTTQEYQTVAADTFPTKEYQPVATNTFATTEYGLPPPRSQKSTSRVFSGWLPEIIWCIISVACIPALVGMLRRFEGQPLPDWPHGITLNTAVAFISTLCRTAFLLPVVQALSQLKWNWYRKPRSLQDFRIFDEASRGLWGSLKLLFTTKGR